MSTAGIYVLHPHQLPYNALSTAQHNGSKTFWCRILPLWNSSIFSSINPNWLEAGQFYPLVILGLDFVSWICIKKFRTFLDVKIDFIWHLAMTYCNDSFFNLFFQRKISKYVSVNIIVPLCGVQQNGSCLYVLILAQSLVFSWLMWSKCLMVFLLRLFFNVMNTIFSEKKLTKWNTSKTNFNQKQKKLTRSSYDKFENWKHYLLEWREN